MAYVIKQILENELPENVIPDFVNWNTHKLYTLVNEEGHLARNDDEHAVIYICSLPDNDIAPFEAYSFLKYWAEEEVKFKKLSAIDILHSDFGRANTINEDFNHLPPFEYENYEYEFHENMNPKSLQKLRYSLVNLHENLYNVRKTLEKYIDYMYSYLETSLKNTTLLYTEYENLISKLEQFIPVEYVVGPASLDQIDNIKHTIEDFTNTYQSTENYKNIKPVRILRKSINELQIAIEDTKKRMNKFARHLEDLFDERDYEYNPNNPRLNLSTPAFMIEHDEELPFY